EARERVKKGEAVVAETAAALEAAAEDLAAAEARASRLLDAAAAARLASTLSPGSPCPVCGSLDHPSAAPVGRARPDDGARGPSGLGNDDGLAAARAAARAAENAASGAKARLEELVLSSAQKEAAAGRYAGALPGPEAAEAARAAKERLAAAERAIAEETERGKAVARARAEREGLRRELDEAAAALSGREADRAAAAASVAEAENGAGEADPGPMLTALRQARDSAAAERSRHDADVAAWRKRRGDAVAKASEASLRLERAARAAAEADAELGRALEAAGIPDEEAWSAAAMAAPELAEARARYRARAAAESSSAARFAAAERAVGGLGRPDLAAVSAALEAASGAYALARGHADGAARIERELAASVDALAAARTARAALRERGDRLVAMSRLLNGETEGRRLSFKNFALGSYFGLVVERASARLREMSDGRYDMSVDRSSGRGRIGLDLAVLDSYTGVARPASSLSGGEKFLASISLALGLSEVIVARAGGASLDSIFIDEGFGSLDDETLDRAMAALDRVRGERVIGIVSHVAELKGRVPARVEVVKTSAGSSLRVIA
ncbi:MAG: hypothetical protein KKB59_14545, partial [Spirochaetes bacterium]|nr:hypothetical protein [Spirochaetota bacterium]